jgi:hypothetical protein
MTTCLRAWGTNFGDSAEWRIAGRFNYTSSVAGILFGGADGSSKKSGLLGFQKAYLGDV